MLPREYRGVGFAVVLFVLIQLGALALVPEFVASGYEPVENPQDPANSVVYIGAVLGATVLMLAAFRFELDWAVRLVIVAVSGLMAWYVFGALLSPTLGVLPAAAVSLALLVYPEWYVIDAAGIVMGAGAAGLFGISFGLLPALILLTALAVYDAISVYGTEHMLSLAEGVMDLQIPVVLVIPLTASYSLFEDDFSGAADVHETTEAEAETETEVPTEADAAAETETDAAADTETEPATRAEAEITTHAEVEVGDEEPDWATEPEGEPPEEPDRDAFFIGLGDAVIPAVLVASAVSFSPAPTFELLLVSLNLPAVFAMGGTIAGLLVLMHFVMKGRAQAGLPLLNGGSIAGYLVGSVVAGVPLLEAVGLASLI
ncbi:presenilin family intramembrane aspartyl protease PSH [Haloparvum sp. PAK95]|uniref:presenilin family intramembrane aspartyl protease PSH n=1 Tax=Haloparvum sp. PAK95 TaxID=3418962 RepID=UPI003D2EF31E